MDALMRFQFKHYRLILLTGLVLTGICFKNAAHLITTVATELIHLLPDHYPSVELTDEMGKKFNRRSNLYVIVTSPDPDANERAVKKLKPFLESHPLVGEAEIEKQGYDFIDKNKLMLMDLEDLYKIRDRLKDKIQKEKLGGLYIDLEEDAGETTDGGNFDELVQNYKDKYTQGVQSRYRRNEDGTVYVVDMYPKAADSSLKFFKTFGAAIDESLQKFDFAAFHPAMKFGYAGAIKTRVDQYDALMQDLSVGGAVSMSSIFIVLYIYFGRMIRQRQKGPVAFLWTSILRLVPVVLVFVPMVYSTIMAFAFCSLFFDKLNVVTSFLFAIIFGLGVDIGIHLVTRYIQDRSRGYEIGRVHHDILHRTGKSCATSVLTTVASFYILVVNDFKGFSDFGWIAGNGLVIALASYLIFQPCLVLLVERYHLFGRGMFDTHLPPKPKRSTIPFARAGIAVFAAFTVVSIFLAYHVGFEWNFGKLKMKIAAREEQKELLKGTINRVNAPAAYLIHGPVEARALSEALRRRKAEDKTSPTIQFFRSYYDLAPIDQDEKLALLKDVRAMLEDDALSSLKDDEKKLVDEFKTAIDGTEKIEEKNVPEEVSRIFWGDNGDRSTSAAYVMPRADLELDNGINARAFADDVGSIGALGTKFLAVSDAIVFSEVLQTLFRGSRIAITLSSLVLIGLIVAHYREFEKTTLVVFALASGICWMFALMVAFDLKLNFYNMIIIPAMIGMGEDNSVHVLDRFEEFGRGSMLDVLRTSGGAAFMASLTTILGYAGLCFAHHPGLNSIGWMAIIGLCTCLASSLIFLPLLAQVFLKPLPARA